jgi:hypothetical protein
MSSVPIISGIHPQTLGGVVSGVPTISISCPTTMIGLPRTTRLTDSFSLRVNAGGAWRRFGRRILKRTEIQMEIVEKALKAFRSSPKMAPQVQAVGLICWNLTGRRPHLIGPLSQARCFWRYDSLDLVQRIRVSLSAASTRLGRRHGGLVR